MEDIIPDKSIIDFFNSFMSENNFIILYNDKLIKMPKNTTCEIIEKGLYNSKLNKTGGYFFVRCNLWLNNSRITADHIGILIILFDLDGKHLDEFLSLNDL